MTPPASIGIRNGSATITAHASTGGHLPITNTAATATAASATTAPTPAPQRMAMDDLQLRRVPDVGEQQHRGEHERAEHRQRLNPPIAMQHDHGRERRGHDDPDLGQRSP